jgi:hypothetical protein
MRGNYLVYKVKSMQRATHQRLIEQLRAHPPAGSALDPRGAGPAAAAAGPAFRVPALVFGELESAVRGFHAALDRAID